MEFFIKKPFIVQRIKCFERGAKDLAAFGEAVELFRKAKDFFKSGNDKINLLVLGDLNECINKGFWLKTGAGHEKVFFHSFGVAANVIAS